ncbi:MAG TPA: dephospho-CoA kinase [Bacteriovoracaceae bacterium]|nr:dephospho-CoA kinase [Bacteriovoracaceae bacterium]
MKKLKAKYVRLDRETRLYGMQRPIIGLTGGIATGKSTVSRLLATRGLDVIDADRLVKNIYKKTSTIDFIKGNFPAAWVNEEINFPSLRQLFYRDPGVKGQIEEFIYQQLPEAFLDAMRKTSSKQDFIIYDVPLLFEKKLNEKVDLSVVVYAPASVQKARLLDRDGHLEEMAALILKSQWEIEIKMEKAEFVIKNVGSMTELAAETDQFLLQVLE